MDMVQSNLEFEWDLSKESANIKKHGLTFTEAVSCFDDLNGIQLRDRVHSSAEPRYYWVAKSQSERILTTWFTLLDKRIRIIGCAEWRKFRRMYDEATKT